MTTYTIKGKGVEVSDGYHTFEELYDHRITLWIALCRKMAEFHHRSDDVVWRSQYHSDGTNFDGWFILGMGYAPNDQITYHLPWSEWVNCDFAKELERAPNFDGHTANDVLERLKKL